MAIDADKLSSPTTRLILVTDVEWRFDFGLKDAVTLREGDTIDAKSEPGWVVVTLQPVIPGGFPEVVRHQITKIISERHQMRVMEVPVSPPKNPIPAPVVTTASVDAPVAPAPAPTGDVPPEAGFVLQAEQDSPPSESPSPRRRAPRRKTSSPSESA